MQESPSLSQVISAQRNFHDADLFTHGIGRYDLQILQYIQS